MGCGPWWSGPLVGWATQWANAAPLWDDLARRDAWSLAARTNDAPEVRCRHDVVDVAYL